VTTHTSRGVRRSAVLAITSASLTAGALFLSLAYASPAAANATPTVLTATAPTVATHADIRATRASVYRGDALQISARVGYGTAGSIHGQVVSLQRSHNSTWTTVGALRLGATGSGYAVFTVRPPSTARYRVVYAGGAPFAPSVSAALPVTVSPATKAMRVVSTAAAQSGKWYRFGAAGPGAFDCSGLTLYAFRQVGVSLPHNANTQKAYGHAVSRAAARPGDLVIFVSGGYGYHAGIYAGGGYMYDAPHSGTTVGKHKIWTTSVVFRRLV
jgi:cell wall-associated NlpC family hydrolase